MDKDSKTSWDIAWKTAVIIAGLLVSILTFRAIIQKEVSDITNNDEFLNDLASKINPYLIFDSNGSYLHNGGAINQIEDLVVVKKTILWSGDSIIAPIRITLKTKEVLSFEPQISCLDSDTKGYIQVRRGPKTTWIFDLSQWLSNDPGGVDTFRVDLIP